MTLIVSMDVIVIIDNHQHAAPVISMDHGGFILNPC